jgi:hypothetical protein
MIVWIPFALAASPETFPLPPKPALAPLSWVVERNEGSGVAGQTPDRGVWVAYPGLIGGPNPWNRLRKGPNTLVRATTTFSHDLAKEPWLEIEVPRASMAWRLTGAVGDGPEVLLADAQLAGSLRLDLAAALHVTGVQSITLHVYASPPRREIDFGARFLATSTPSRAEVALGDLATVHGRALADAVGLTSITPGWPRLWWNRGNRAAWQKRAGPDLAGLAGMLKAKTPFVVDPSKGPDQLLDHGLAFHPPLRDPNAAPADPSYAYMTRDLLWSGYNQWELAAAVSDDPEIVAQARRWTLDLAASRFWEVPGWAAWDDGTAFSLQSLAEGYDVAHDAMTPDERAQVRGAMHAIATNFYWNIVVGNGYIENDLRSNHAASSLDGLAMAGLVLLGEDPDAPAWVGLAEVKMKDAFAIHTSGASWESPAYGRFGTDEWFRLSTTLANVTGREHRNDPFFKKHADYDVAVADWDGRDLGYNQGGPHQWWNQWVLLGIAAFTRDPTHQWIGSPDHDDEGSGYGERLFYYDPTVPREKPAGRNVGTLFSDIGLAVWRTGWNKNDTLVGFHDGPRPATHQDRDAGEVTLYGRGHRFLSDGLGALSVDHNLVSWDNQQQDQYQGGSMSRFYQDPRAGAATGDYQGWRRVVLYLRPDVVVLVDRLNVFDQQPDRVALSTFHLTADKVGLDKSTFTAVEGDTALQGTIVLDNDVVPDGRLGPGPSGAKTVAWRFAGAGKPSVNAITLLSLSGATEAGAVTVTRDGSAWTFETTTAKVRVGLGKGTIVDGVSADAEVWAARVDPGGPRTAVACGGAHALAGAKDPVATADCAAATLP